ncbi:hypothetical protein Tco_1212937 [Tanacetum coccineum]
MGPTWKGPYIVKKAYGDGAYKLETLSGSPVNRTWKGSNLHEGLECDESGFICRDFGFFESNSSTEAFRSAVASAMKG